MSVAELASELGMSQMTLYRAIAAGEFPAVRIGRRLVVPARVLQDMADQALATGTTVDTADWAHSRSTGDDDGVGRAQVGRGW